MRAIASWNLVADDAPTMQLEREKGLGYALSFSRWMILRLLEFGQYTFDGL